MTLRQLWWMADARRELEGEAAAFIVQMIPVGVWMPAEIGKMRHLNPFRGEAKESEAMRAHREKWKAARWASWTGGG